MSMPKHRLLRVEWEDSASRGKWHRTTEIGRRATLQCESVGYVVRSDKHEIVLAQSICENEDINDTMAIPRGCIRKVRRLQGKP